MGYLLAHWHEVAYLLLAAIIVGIYIVHFLPGLKESSLRRILEAETILIVILVFVAIIAARVETVSRDVEERTDMLKGNLESILLSEGLARVQKIGNMEELYAELNAARQRTGKEIRLTMLRFENPESLVKNAAGQARLWIDGIEGWLNAGAGRVYYEVVGVPNESVRAWLQKECTALAGSTNRGLRSVESRPKTSEMNLVIFDRSEVFLVASPLHGPLAATQAYHISDPGFAEFTAAAYDELYRNAVPCGAGR